MNLTSDIRNKLKLDITNNFLRVKDIENLPNKKFDRILYCLDGDDNEESVCRRLTAVCDKGGLILTCAVPNVNKRLSNGMLKHNKNILMSLMKELKIERFWFFSSEKKDCFDFLFEV